MGIFGLQGLLLHNRDKFASKEKLKDTTLIIDCNNLQHALLDRAFLSEKSYNFRVDKYGCNFKEYAKIVRDFFDNLNQCGITPILVVDGSLAGKGDFTGLKESREILLQTSGQQKIDSAQLEREYPIEKGNLLIPRLFKVIFREITRKLAIETHQVAYEANHLTVRLAREHNCPVLAGDSDFIIYNIEKGFIILKSFFCKKNKAGNYIECDVFKQEKFLQLFPGLKPDCLPILNVLLGKHSEKMQTFGHIAGPIVDDGQIKVTINAKSKLQQRIVRLLEWLAGRSREEALAFIMDKIDEAKRQNAQEFCLNILNIYNPNRVSDIGTELESIYPPHQQAGANGSHPARYLSRLFRLYDLTGPCLNIILGKSEHDVSFLGDFSKPSPYELEFRPFSVAMTLLRPKSIDKLKQEGCYDEDKQVFQVYTRRGEENEPKFGKFDIKPMEHLRGFGSLNHLDCYSMIKLPTASKRLLLMETFRYNEDELSRVTRLLGDLFLRQEMNNELAISMMLVKYIAIETNRPVDQILVASLLLMIFAWAAKERKVNFRQIQTNRYKRLSEKIQPHQMSKNAFDYPDEPELYRSLVHNNMSLQAVYRSYFMLNNLLDDSCCNMRPDLWFDGRLMFRLMILLDKVGVRRFLECVPRLVTLVDDVVFTLRASIRDSV